MREQYIEAVLAVAELIPPSRVLSYGDIAALLESGGPRQVGAAMAAQGSAAPWWRVIRAGGAAPLCHEGRALEHYLAEDTPLRGDTSARTPPGKPMQWRVDMKAARWNPAEPDFDRIDAIAARLRESDGADGHDAGTHHRAAMSDPRGGLEA
ncbi:alkylated DNA nucleotide flippase Atl1 [Arthrobacter stackebrandtii]|uniref:Alkylated DNA nucleotide flippase Atl1 n=1 Tax=Arthrobacter stackebrandtii TaxID=272161 RepID=A0ABS4YXT5_9MICC|nr:MGMT family protein [Arthrobacter stackebrandtii]MBP2413621.1 alkylated DNA nucleotide flippase Atl1 [Arthrobacter stackebrandtii]PYH00560.1 cysteine methyltransferase [Arthrobacter stackebrandtii]